MVSARLFLNVAAGVERLSAVYVYISTVKQKPLDVLSPNLAGG